MNFNIDQLHPLVLNVGLATHNGDWNWKGITSPFNRIYYVTEGNAKIILPNKTLTLRPNHLYFIPAFTKHTYFCNKYFRHYYIHIYEDNQDGVNILNNWEFPNEIEAGEYELGLIQALCNINPFMKLPHSDPKSYDNDPTLMENLIKNKKRKTYDKIESRGIVYILLAKFIKYAKEKDKSKDERIKKTLEYIHSNIYDCISLDKLAEMTFLSKDHFIRLFKQEIGITPLQYINLKKIEKAQLILVTEDTSIKNIAFRLSFNDYSYFNRLFKKITKVTPKEYKNTINNHCDSM